MNVHETAEIITSAGSRAVQGSKRIVYVLIGLAHFPYHESIIDELCKLGIFVDLAILKHGSRENITWDVIEPTPVGELLRTFRDFMASHPNLSLINIEKKELAVPETAEAIRYLRSYASYLRRFPTENFYRKRWLDYMPEGLGRLAGSPWMRFILRMPYTERFLGWLDTRLKPNKFVSRKLAELNPDMVVISPGNMRYSYEVEWLKAAKKRGIRTAIVTLSWDNLTTKGLIHARPDHLFVWNKSQADEAKEIHHIADEALFVAGAPFFDKWRRPDQLLEERVSFLTGVGLDSARNYIVYLGSSANIADNESWLIRELYNEIIKSSDPLLRDVQIYVRPHPGNRKICADLADILIVLSPDEEVRIPFSTVRKKRLFNIIAHSALAVGINTSAIIDAAAIGKPCVSIKTDRYKDTHTDSAHFRHLSDSGAVMIADGTKECVRIIGEHLRGADPSKSGRQSFLEKYIQSPVWNKSSGETVAWIASSLMNGSSPKEIRRAMPAQSGSVLG